VPTLDELNGVTGQLHDALAAGIADISQATTVCFSVYHKVVLPLDGFVFWLRAGDFDQAGSIHWMTDRRQDEAETHSDNTIVFTTQEEVQSLNATNSDTLVVGDIEGRQYAFNRHGWYFPQAGVWHYQGEGLNASVASQLVDDPSQIDMSKLIVSDSLPAWLALVSYDPVWISWPKDRNPHITLYPSYLVPDNQPTPYGSVHIEPTRIDALQSMPWLSSTYSHYQLTKETVRVTLYGCDNAAAADWLDLVEQYTLDTDAFGIMNMPTLRDGKRTWTPGMMLAQQKFVEFEVSYVQTRINDIARQLIIEALARVLPDDLSRTFGIDPRASAEADFQSGPMTLIANTIGIFNGTAGFIGAPQVSAAGTTGTFAASAGIAATPTSIITAISATFGASASFSAVAVVPQILSGVQMNASAGFSGSCRVLASMSGRMDAVAG
jgi:hypothetical protein